MYDLLVYVKGLKVNSSVIFFRLTVEEHLWFYARLKGMPSNQVKEEMKW